jgi:hypothetical protein
MLDMLQMMGKLKDLQSKMKAAQESLVHIKASAEAGAGLVKVTVNGQKQLHAIEIDDTLLNTNDKAMLVQLIIGATNKAMEEVEQLAQEHLKKQTEGLLPNIPGLDLSKLTGQS